MNAVSAEQRSVHIAGSIALPTPFPSLARIYFEPAADTSGRQHLVIQGDASLGGRTSYRVAEEHVVALFFPNKCKKGRPDVVDLDRGDWFLYPRVVTVQGGVRLLDVGIDLAEIASTLGVRRRRLRGRGRPVRGIVYVRPEAPLAQLRERYASAADIVSGSHYGGRCDCDCDCCCDGYCAACDCCCDG